MTRETWRKRAIEANDGTPMDCWRSSCGTYRITYNINHGNCGPDGAPGGWWYELIKLEAGQEVYLGEAVTLKAAKRIKG